MANTRKSKAYQSGNTRVVKTTYKQIIRNGWFQLGYNSVLTNKPFNYDIAGCKEAWAYERGRLFAKVYNGRLIYRNNVEDEAERALVHAYKNKHLV